MLNKLKEPVSLGKLTLKNRVVFPPITTNLATDKGLVSGEMLEYYRLRAEGGPGLIIVEPGIVSPEGNLIPHSLSIYNDESLEGLAALAETIKRAGAKAFIQLAHVGPKGHVRVNGRAPLAPSQVEMVRGQTPQEMSIGEIEEMTEKFVSAAKRASQAGFDGVELHAAHFYLLGAFLSPFTNSRNDKYGGSVESRVLILKEIIRGIKERVGQDFPVICRIHGSELVSPGLDRPEARQVALELEQSGADGLHISAYSIPEPEGGYYTIAANCIPGPDDEPGIFVDQAAYIKEAVGIPVITVGKINNPALAEAIIADGKADLVAVGRQLVADPATVKKWFQGKEYLHCINCNGCFKSMRRKGIKCALDKDLC